MSTESVSAQLMLPTNPVESACWRVAIRTAIVLAALKKPVPYFSGGQLGRIATAVNERTPFDLEEALNPEGFQFAVARMFPSAPEGERVLPSLWLIHGLHAAFSGGSVDMLTIEAAALTSGVARKLEMLPEWFNVTPSMMDAANIIESYTNAAPRETMDFLNTEWKNYHTGERRFLPCFTSSMTNPESLN